MKLLWSIAVLVAVCSWTNAQRESRFCPTRRVETVTFQQKYRTCKGGWWFWRRECSDAFRIASRSEVRVDRKACCPGWSGEDCSAPECTGGQVWNDCGTCQPTCKTPSQMCTMECKQQCECPRSAPVWHEGRCITAKSCPAECTGGQVWNDCGTCQPTCKTQTPICTMECKQQCECPTSAPVWHEGRCITTKSCPAVVTSRCPVGEPAKDPSGAAIFCGRGPNREDCPSGYSCNVHPNDLWAVCCTEEIQDTPECTGGQVWNECGTCQPTCKTQTPRCTKECKRQCECPRSSPVWHQGRCMSAKSCPAVVTSKCPVGQPAKDSSGAEIFCGRGPTREDCPFGYSCNVHPTDRWAVCCTEKQDTRACTGGRVWKDCGGCEPTCDNQTPKCPRICRPKCKCPAERPVWTGTECGLLKSCKQSQCTGGREWMECGGCDKTCDNPTPMCPEVCMAKCQCPRNKPLWTGTDCVTTRACPSK